MDTARPTRLPPRTRPDAGPVTSRARTALPAATQAPPSGLAALQRMADASPATRHLQTLRGLSETSRSAAPGVVQRASVAQVANCIGAAVSPAAESKKVIVADLAQETGGQETSLRKKSALAFGRKTTGAEVDAAVKTEVENAAKQKGYGDDAATRLVDRTPFGKGDIGPNSTLIPDEGKVTSFEGVMSDIMDPQAHQLYFANSYANGNWTMADNFRNPYLAAFFASDVIEVQKALVDDKAKDKAGDLKTLTRANVVSESGVAWAKKNTIKDGPMSKDLLASFLTETENGRSSLGIAKQENVRIVSGTLSGVNDTGSMAYKSFSVHLDCAKDD